MVRTKRVHRDQIIDGAYQLIIKEGFKKFHARNIAQQVACSTQPIYREFHNLAELKTVLTRRIIAKYSDFLEDQQPKNIHELTNTIVNYANDYPEEFQRFFLQDKETIDAVKQITQDVFSRLEFGPSQQKINLMFPLYWQYCIGKAVLMANHLEDVSDESELLATLFQ